MGFLGGDSALLPLPEEPFLPDGEDGKLFAAGGGPDVPLTSLSSSRATEAPRLPKLLRLLI